LRFIYQVIQLIFSSRWKGASSFHVEERSRKCTWPCGWLFL